VPRKLDLQVIDGQLKTSLIGRAPAQANELWDSIDSTNQRCLELAAAGAAAGLIVLARQQTAGRGRLGRTWVSKPDAGIYMSILLRPENKSIGALSLLTMAAGVAVSNAIRETTGILVGLKWVNDLVVDGRKVGGILAETSGRAPLYIILGIGINTQLDVMTLPDELQDQVASLHALCTHQIDPNALVCSIAQEVETIYNRLLANETAPILEQWRERSVTLGQNVMANVGAKTIEGKAVDITESGALLIQTLDGHIEQINAGEVLVRRLDGAYC
jgi:BirA family transcriptional regulator, biotin operon repressor / biotin---[acetyl-CoA-carboxylase] ligase